MKSTQVLEQLDQATNGMPLKVLFFVDSLRVGGKERQLCELIKALKAGNGVQPLVVTMGAEQFYVPDINKLQVPLLYLIRKVRWDPMVFVRLARFLRQFRPDIIHADSDMTMFYAWPLARLLGIKIVNASIRNAFSGKGLRWKWHKAMLRLADVCVGNSRAGFLSRDLSPDLPGHYVIHNGFDMGRFQRLASDKSAGLDMGKRKIIGMVAEFSDYKDFPTFIRAAQLVLAKHPTVAFVAVGGGRNLDGCKRMVPPDERRIQFLGQRQDVEALVQQMDIGVLCTFSEGISNSIMEFMAAAKPVIVTDGGGSRELVTEGKTGFLVPKSTPEAVAEKIDLLLSDTERALKVGLAGRSRIERDFSLERLGANSLSMYREVLSGVRQKGSA